ncbi:HNH endonuclease [Laribacter hongkongensis]|uniref:HNH endonuclease n=1 Tax=Laribacter hongkongensis TaxID=168471 RepID=UPI001EFC4B40|nr:HNH endonuclease signature motif containing protein [Laribacter hongkongensis]MCG9081149.1 HNH endonuclease [Laribacter hongkongensis]
MSKLTMMKPRIAVARSERVAVMADSSWRTSGMTAAERGYGHQWRKARASFLRRHPLCVMCLAEGLTVAATVVDHINPHRGDQRLFWDSSNWQPLCASCHSGAKQREERGE